MAKTIFKVWLSKGKAPLDVEGFRAWGNKILFHTFVDAKRENSRNVTIPFDDIEDDSFRNSRSDTYFSGDRIGNQLSNGGIHWAVGEILDATKQRYLQRFGIAKYLNLDKFSDRDVILENRILKAEIDDDFDADLIAREVGVSRSTVYKHREDVRYLILVTMFAVGVISKGRLERLRELEEERKGRKSNTSRPDNGNTPKPSIGQDEIQPETRYQSDPVKDDISSD